QPVDFTGGAKLGDGLTSPTDKTRKADTSKINEDVLTPEGGGTDLRKFEVVDEKNGTADAALDKELKGKQAEIKRGLAQDEKDFAKVKQAVFDNKKGTAITADDSVSAEALKKTMEIVDTSIVEQQKKANPNAKNIKPVYKDDIAETISEKNKAGQSLDTGAVDVVKQIK
ncbi:MAG: hypothetical protein HY075_04520, partial [Deltaproteobacteria bacterium]|nr:hypothetical protein [Deltaproteobacteria bacterium]